MDKKDIYEHLASIYLDASSKKKKRSRQYSEIAKRVLTVVAVVGLAAFIVNSYAVKNRFSKNSEVALVFLPDVAKINFHFDPARKEIYSLNMDNLDLTRYKALGFSLKKSDFEDVVCVRVEFTNRFNEKSEIYVKDIPHKWRDYVLSLSRFDKIKDWREIKNLSFIIEEWNARFKKDVVYIHNIRLLKK